MDIAVPVRQSFQEAFHRSLTRLASFTPSMSLISYNVFYAECIIGLQLDCAYIRMYLFSHLQRHA